MTLDITFQSVMAYSEMILGVLVVLFVGLLAYFFLRRSIDKLYEREYISLSIHGFLQVISRWTVIILIILLGLQQLGVQLTSVWSALSAFVVLIGVGLFAVWSVLSNVLCSLLLLLFRPFSIGDQIEVSETLGGDGLKGKVVNLNLLYTFVLEEEGRNGSDKASVVQIPNNIFFQKVIRRWQGYQTRSLEEIMFQDDEESIQQNAAL